jgi:hypothetical protein
VSAADVGSADIREQSAECAQVNSFLPQRHKENIGILDVICGVLMTFIKNISISSGKLKEGAHIGAPLQYN